MPGVFNLQQAMLDGVSSQDIQDYLKNNPDVTLPPAQAQGQTPPAQVSQPPSAPGAVTLDAAPQTPDAPVTPTPSANPLVNFLQGKTLDTVGAIGGGIVGGIADVPTGAVPGAVAGSAVGGAGAEWFRRGLLRVMGQGADPGSTADSNNLTEGLKAGAIEGALDGVLEGVGGKVMEAGGKIVGKVAGNAADKLATLLNVQPENFFRNAFPGVTAKQYADATGKQIAKDPTQSLATAILSDKNAAGQGLTDNMQNVAQARSFIDNRKIELAGQITDAAKAQDKLLADQAASGALPAGQQPFHDPKQILNDIKTGLADKGITVMKGSSKLQPNGEAINTAIDEEFNRATEAYGDKWTNENLLNFKQSLDTRLSSFARDGAFNPDDVTIEVANDVRGRLNDSIPGLSPLNAKYAAYADLGEHIDPTTMKVLGNTFGSSIQSHVISSVLTPAATAVGGLVGGVPGAVAGGSLAGGASLLATQALKSPEIAGKVAQTLFNIKNMAGEVPPLLKTFYTVMQPVVLQGARGLTRDSAATPSANGTDGTQMVSPVMQKLLPDPSAVGMTDIPTGQYKTATSVTNPDGSLNDQGIGLTPQQIAVAMLADPQHAALYKQVYDVLNVKDPAAAKATAAQQTAMSKINSAYGVLNTAQSLYSKIQNKGTLGGGWTQLANDVTKGNADPTAAAYEQLRMGTLTQIARIINGDGIRVPISEQNRSEFLPKITDSAEQAQLKWTVLEHMLEQRKQEALTSPTGGELGLDSYNGVTDPSSTSTASDTLNSVGQ